MAYVVVVMGPTEVVCALVEVTLECYSGWKIAGIGLVFVVAAMALAL